MPSPCFCPAVTAFWVGSAGVVGMGMYTTGGWKALDVFVRKQVIGDALMG